MKRTVSKGALLVLLLGLSNCASSDPPEIVRGTPEKKVTNENEFISLPFPDAELVVMDPFDGAKLWPWSGNGRWMYQDIGRETGSHDGRVYSGRTENPKKYNTLAFLTNPGNVGDGVIEARMRVDVPVSDIAIGDERDREEKRIAGNVAGAGLIFRKVDDDNYYIFRSGGERGYVLGKIVNGEWVEIKHSDQAYLHFKEWHTLRVSFHGTDIICSVDGKAIIRQQDSTHMLGEVGLTSFRAWAEYDYFALWTFRNM
jgi:hypothetical protein